MSSLLRISEWPLLVKVPVLVAGLMVTVAFTISQVVLWRFVQNQEKNLEYVTSAYLDGLSIVILPAIIRGDVWEVFDALDRARDRARESRAGIQPRFTIVALPDDKVLAASDPLRFPTQSALPDELRARFAADGGLQEDPDAGRAWLVRTLGSDQDPVGRLYAEMDISSSLHSRREILLMLVLVNGCLTLGFALVGYLVLKRMLQPFAVLTRHMEHIRDGCVQPIPEENRVRVAQEFGHLFGRFNAMAQALNERQALQAQFAGQEKLAMLGRLASGLAHEVNNPLGGMLNAIYTIQAHGNDPAVLQKSLDILKRGLEGIRNVARATLVTYKGGSDTNLLTPTALDDLPSLLQHETGSRRLRLDWQNQISEPLAIDGAAVRQITLNLLLNACAASPLGGRVVFAASCREGTLRIEVSDEGPGIPRELATLLDPAAPAVGWVQETKGLGLWITGYVIRRLGGRAKVEYPGIGTRVVMSLPAGTSEVLDAAA